MDSIIINRDQTLGVNTRKVGSSIKPPEEAHQGKEAPPFGVIKNIGTSTKGPNRASG